MAEGPNLVAFDPRRGQVAQVLVLVGGASGAKLDQEFRNRVD